jgi:hypothetical protein
MYSNSKEQLSLEEAYNMVHLEHERQDPREGLTPQELEKLEAEDDGCSCDHDGDDDKKCNCDDKKIEECISQIAENALVQAGVDFIKDPSLLDITTELARWSLIAAGTYVTGKLFLNQSDAEKFISELITYSTFKNRTVQIQNDLKSSNIQRIKKGHNEKVRMLKTLDNWLIRRAVKMGLLDDPRHAIDILDKNVDFVDNQIKELEKTYKDQ